MNGPSPFDPMAGIAALVGADVEFVIIGGVAARLHGSPSLTRDLDICYSRDPANVDRLVSVLQHLHARLRDVPRDVPFILDARTIRAGANFTFVTDAGDLDVLAAPAGTDGFIDLQGSAITLDIDGAAVLVATIDDLIRMKRAAARPKDLAEVEILEALRHELG